MNAKHLLAAIRFMSIIPLGHPDIFEPKAMLPFFPLVGLILGGLLVVCDLLFQKFWPGPVVALLDIILLVILTGGLHLDGLGDTADGLYGNRTREKALAIMKDSRIGAMALLAIVLCLAVKWAGLAALTAHRSLFLLIIPAYARTSILFGVRFLPYGRPEGGTGHAFFKDRPVLTDFWGLLIPVTISLFLGWRGLLINLCFVAALALIMAYYHRKLGCITGDMLGAMTEISEAALFLSACTGGSL
jgi:adenosylcobinamide-GDP ribazoletransferase